MEIEPHGGNIYRLAQKYRIAVTDIRDFSSNINPLGIPEELQRLLAASLAGLIHYPDPESLNLRNSISRYLAVPPNRIITGNGAAEIIFLLLATLKPRRLLLCQPTFAEYEKAAVAAGVAVDCILLEEASDFRFDIDKFIARAGECDCILLCNPNNPTSVLLERDKIAHILDQAKKTGATVIIDEAFIELTLGNNANSAVDLLSKYNQLFIIRSFTKIFAIPGLRLGYGLGDPRLISGMWRQKPPWSVNRLADCVGEYLPQAGAFFSATSRWLAAEKEWLYQKLATIPGLKPFAPEANFILVKLLLQRIKAATIQDQLAKRGILIRNAANFPGLNGQFFRLAVKNRADNQFLAAVLQEELQEVRTCF